MVSLSIAKSQPRGGVMPSLELARPKEPHVIEELRHKPGHLVWRAYQLTWSLFAEECGSLDITPVQEALMLVLASRPGVDQKTLAELVALDRSTAGNVIGRLEERGLIARVQSASDRRARELSLTPCGEEMSKKLRPIARRAAKRLLEPLGPLERPEFMRLLRKVTSMADPLDAVEPSRSASLRLDGVKMMIVGSNDGFGREIVERAEAEGAQVALVSLPSTSNVVGSEFSDSLQEAHRRLGRIDVLLNGGGIGGDQRKRPNLERNSANTLNVVGMRWTAMTRILPHFLENGCGRVINLAIMPNGTLPSHLLSDVIASNAAIVALTREFATDYRRNGIVANSISPRVERLVPPQSKDMTVSTRLVHVAPADVASTVAYLASADARFVSASDLVLG